MIILPVEGVLAPLDCLDALKGMPPSPEGQSLYSLLIATGDPVVLLSAQRSRQEVEDWLALEGFTRWVQLHHRGVSALGWSEYRISVLREQLAIGRKFKFYIDSDPGMIKAVTDMGVPSLLVVEPGRRVGRISPSEQSYQSWDTLVNTIETRSQTKANLTARSLDVQEA